MTKAKKPNINLIEEMRVAVEYGLHDLIENKLSDSPESFMEMLTYQMGWTGEGSGIFAQGKRIRPLMLLLVCHACGGDWHKAIPAAVGIELLHNFTLIHDDIQDRSLTRRGRETIWVKWGEAQAINAGDALYALAYTSHLRLHEDFTFDVVLRSIEQITSAALRLTNGQYLDIAYEKVEEINLDDYWKMIQDKTGELLAVCFTTGALLAGKNDSDIPRYKELGLQIGTAFQVQDDWLGIWGDQNITGKSVKSDVRDRKKTFPILMAISELPAFCSYWSAHQSFSDQDSEILIGILNQSSIKEKTLRHFNDLYADIFRNLFELFPQDPIAKPLFDAIYELLGRSR